MKIKRKLKQHNVLKQAFEIYEVGGSVSLALYILFTVNFVF